MSKAKASGYVRVRERTRRAINMLAAELQLASGENRSADDAIAYAIEQLRPDLMQRADEQIESEDKQ